MGKRTHAAAQPVWASFQLPDFFVQSNAPEWTDPARPGVFALEPTPAIEAQVLGQYLLREHGGERIAVWHTQAFREAAFVLLRHGFTPQAQRKESDTSLKALQGIVKNLKRARPQVVVALAEYGDLLRFLRAFAAEEGTALGYMGTALADAETVKLLDPTLLERLRLLTALPLTLEQDHPGIRLHRKLLEEYTPDLVMSRWTIQGQAAAELMTAVLERSGRDLSASTALRSAERLYLPNSHLLPPVELDSQQHRALTSLRVIQLHPDRVEYLSDWIDGR
jgi:ABC-type branched-subunit amino acid transport system substrate-binding protein